MCLKCTSRLAHLLLELGHELLSASFASESSLCIRLDGGGCGRLDWLGGFALVLDIDRSSVGDTVFLESFIRVDDSSVSYPVQS